MDTIDLVQSQRATDVVVTEFEWGKTEHARFYSVCTMCDSTKQSSVCTMCDSAKQNGLITIDNDQYYGAVYAILLNCIAECFVSL